MDILERQSTLFELKNSLYRQQQLGNNWVSLRTRQQKSMSKVQKKNNHTQNSLLRTGQIKLQLKAVLEKYVLANIKNKP